MKVLYLKNGKTLLEEAPVPQVQAGCVLIRTTYSLVSLGTERMLVEFGQANIVGKALQQPDKVRQVWDKMKTDGLPSTLESVFHKLEQAIPLGYCNAGVVVAVGEGVSEFRVGDRVASNGNHAEFVLVPQNLVAKIPDKVTDQEAAFTVMGAIGLQGIRLVKPQLGETIVVFGLGLVGLITAQLLQAHGCRVIGIDPDAQKSALAHSWGIETPAPDSAVRSTAFVQEITQNIGADGVIITASSPTNDIIHESCEMCRKRGRIVLVGVVGLDLRRDDFYKKELSFQVSCSYGPGRYDPEYEQKGNDYPLPYVRWTEKRNLEAVLQALARHSIEVLPLISEEVALADYATIYNDMRKKGSIASLIRYPLQTPIERVIAYQQAALPARNKAVVGIIGAGNYTSSMLLPSLLKTDAQIRYVASAQGLNAKLLARKAHATFATSDYTTILQDPEVDMVMISTRHNLHAPMVIQALEAGKQVFVEKPLCLTQDELDAIVSAHQKSPLSSITVGFNRRFSPLTQKLKKALGNGQVQIVATMNAGFIAPEMWVHDLQIGGGRLLGEACHLIDLCAYLAESLITAVCTNALGVAPQGNSDNVSIMMKFANGSTAVIHYFANGSKSYAKERVEVFSEGRVFVLDNWRRLKGYGTPRWRSLRGRLNKGQKEMFASLIHQVEQGGEPLIPFSSLVNTTRASLAALQSLRENRWVSLNE